MTRKDATQSDYDRVGFKAGLEVHQQLKTKKKLFCNCPAGVYHKNEEYDAEIIRHMRPTLSELGEYDGTALMEFKTRKNIIYRIKNETTCTYEIDDTPPFPINREALNIALEISLLSKFNIVGEVHITRKQYLDGSIPTGFQRTAILGVEGEIQLKNKKIRLIQLSIEEDACREISDIGHIRTYKTDRLGIPLIETVTHPDFSNPDEVKEGAEYIRYLNRSTGKVRVGSGAGREDVNVSCRNGSRVEIKGVSHIKLIPELTHNEVFRQFALLEIRDKLHKRFSREENRSDWGIRFQHINPVEFPFLKQLKQAVENQTVCAAGINIPGFRGILSHFTQPGQTFANELSDRLKVIACIEKPNMLHSEQFDFIENEDIFQIISRVLSSENDDAQLLIWGLKEDIPTAIETIEERCRMAFDGVPNESRKSFMDGTTIFERVLPGADRMYPDTDSPPIPIEDKDIQKFKDELPKDIHKRYTQLKKWDIPEDTHNYILRNNLCPLLEKIIKDLDVNPKFAGTLFGHTLKHIEGQLKPSPGFEVEKVYHFLSYLNKNELDLEISKSAMLMIYKYPEKDFDSILKILKYRKINRQNIVDKISDLKREFKQVHHSKNATAQADWIMGKLRPLALGNMNLKALREAVEKTNLSSQGNIRT
ncbi:MAG: Glu-tRNA(Gln) amidotransferase subunit GatE [Candidatus Aminicenantes bacterium]|nr:Glu-tRNA(Gln) amidotransferase subunit GatE [Candidatus Aminicenantes bacterium]